MQVNLRLWFGVKEQRGDRESGFWERLRAGKGRGTAREEGDPLAGGAGGRGAAAQGVGRRGAWGTAPGWTGGAG